MRKTVKLAIKKMKGIELTRRENNLIIQTVAEIFRIIPWAPFAIIPLFEYTLPIFMTIFPCLFVIPTSFETVKQKEAKLKQSLKVKLKMAKFLQETLDNTSVRGKGYSEFAKEFVGSFEKARKECVDISADEILKFTKLFEDEITLDSLSRPQLVALCRILELHSFGTSSILKYMLTRKLRSLTIDDKTIQKEGVDSLTMSELQDACKSRGMSACELNKYRLKQQLTQWIDLSLNERVPPLLLLLSRVFSLKPSTGDLLKKAISALLYCVGESTENDSCECCKTMDNKETVLKTLESAVENLCSKKDKLIKSKTIKLKTELNCYQKHLNDLQEVTTSMTTEKVKELEAVEKLFNELNKITDIIQEFEELEKELVGTKITIDCEFIKIDELLTEVGKIQNVLDDSKVKQMIEVLSIIDSDNNGSVKLKTLLLFIQLNRQNKNLSNTTI